ncbi:hypothetical protein ACFV0L_10190 [Streptosporangium canum]|uniref:hypothetical protein n=1 Tax=Streptosporangium canum TaxID=324952 RepID=UPI00368D3B53
MEDELTGSGDQRSGSIADRKRRSRLIAAAILAFLLIGSSAFIITHCASCQVITCRLWGSPSVSVPHPPDNSPAEEVVQAYINATIAHDVRTSRKLSTIEFAARKETLIDAPYCNWLSVRDLEIDTAVEQSPTGGFRQVMAVGVRFKLQARLHPNMPEDASGKASWGYLLGRNTPREGWKIFDDGAAL